MEDMNNGIDIFRIHISHSNKGLDIGWVFMWKRAELLFLLWIEYYSWASTSFQVIFIFDLHSFNQTYLSTSWHASSPRKKNGLAV